MTFIDALRSQDREEWTYTTYLGFDPDLHNSGLAQVTIAHSSYSRRQVRHVKLWDIHIPAKHRGLSAACAMIEALHATEDLFVGQFGVVEGQQIYPPKGDGRDAVAKLVGQGTDLLNLAHISGAALALMIRHNVDAGILLPAQWKAQAKKEAMHAAARGILANDKPVILVDDSMIYNGVASMDANIHVMDALCMALKRAGYKL